MQLNIEQKKLIQSKPAGHCLIKGVAGSGKTTVAVHRIPFLLNHYCFAEDDRILMVTFNKTLVNYIKHLYEKTEEESNMQFASLFGSNNDKIDIFTIDSLIFKYFLEAQKSLKKKYKVLTDVNKRFSILSQCLIDIQKLYPNVKMLDQKNMKFFMDEIDWIKSCMYTELEEYQNTDRLGRMSKQNAEGPQKLMKNSDTRKSIFELMQLYNNKLKEQGFIDFRDMALVALDFAREKSIGKYTHIIIDESQDLSRVQLEFLKTLYLDKPYASVTFIADTAQSIYAHSWLVKGRSFTTIGYDMTGKSSSLAKNYRTTTQIAEAAYSLLEKDINIVEDDNFVKPSLIDRQGMSPIYKCFSNPQEESEFIINEIKGRLQNIYAYKDIVIIAKNKNQLANMKEALDKANVPCRLFESKDEIDFEGNDIKLITMHSIKGLEFKVVMIIGLNNKTIPYQYLNDVEENGLYETMERKLLYVGMTRANEILYMTSDGHPSKFIEDIDFNYLSLDYGSKFRKFYSIPIEKYNFKEKIIDLYSNEEKVRQWVIKELNEVYKYPLNLLDAEFQVNNFSTVGRVDGVVKIYNNKTPIPYIFIEVKRRGKGISDCCEQLKSYMSNSKTCQYGIATDGNEIVIINKDFEVIDDIPSFNASMLPSSVESYEYVDLKHGKRYEMSRDTSNAAELSLKYEAGTQDYNEESLRKLSIYNNIAAGAPIYMNSSPEGNFCLPGDWFNSMDDYYLLKVKGDSMIGADICDGDLVVLKKQNNAINRDIVAVGIDGNATLKRYMKMGDTILLIAENEKYEPIQIRSEQAEIMGLAIGVIKDRNQ